MYIDAYKDPNTTITELLYWNGSQLYAPFYDPSKNISTATARVSYIPSMDIDADGQIEFPKCSLLPGYYSLTDPKDIESTMWLCDWYAYQYESGKTVREFYAVVNLEDRYYIRIEDGWKDQVTTSYDGETRTLWLLPSSTARQGSPSLACGYKEPGRRANRERTAGISSFGRRTAITTWPTPFGTANKTPTIWICRKYSTFWRAFPKAYGAAEGGGKPVKKILVCEDEVSIREFVVINLKRSGYEVVEAGSGEEALEKYDAEKDGVDIALLDIMLPGMDGFAVCRELRPPQRVHGYHHAHRPIAGDG